MRTPESEDRQRKLPAQGHYKVRCIQWIDFGTQETEWKGVSKQTPQIHLAFELLGTKEVFDPTKGEQPFTMRKTFTLSLADKSNLRPFLESWRGKTFTDEEVKKAAEEVGYLSSLFIGKPGYMYVMHAQGTGANTGKSYANIASLSPLPAEMGKASKAENPIVEFDIERPDAQEVFPTLYKWQQDVISKSAEWSGEAPWHEIPPAEDIPEDEF